MNIISCVFRKEWEKRRRLSSVERVADRLNRLFYNNKKKKTTVAGYFYSIFAFFVLLLVQFDNDMAYFARSDALIW